RLFEGETISHTLADVLRAPIDFSRLPKDTPPAVRRLLRRCLDRDRKRRLPDIGGARLEIDDALTDQGEAPPAAPAAPPASGWSWGRTILALGVLAAALIGWQLWRVPAAGEAWTGSLLGGPTRACAPRISPDGQLLAFKSFVDELPQLGVMKMAG